MMFHASLSTCGFLGQLTVKRGGQMCYMNETLFFYWASEKCEGMEDIAAVIRVS